jgi:hypothetical protein
MKRFKSLLLSLLIMSPIIAMEPVPLLMRDENTPLIAPRQLLMNEQSDENEKEKSIFFDGTRRFYNEEGCKQMCKETCKEWLCMAAITGISCGCLVGGCGEAFAGCFYACSHNSLGCALFETVQGGLFLDCCVLGCGATSGAGTVCWGYIFGVAILNQCDTDIKQMKWHRELSIPAETLKDADPHEIIWFEKSTIQSLLDHATARSSSFFEPLALIRNIKSGFFCSQWKIRNQINARLSVPSLLRRELAHKFRQEHRLPKDLIMHLFTYINFSDLNKYSCISKKELLYLLNGLSASSPISQNAQNLVHYIILAQNGWLSLNKNEKYPIRCEMKYIDATALPQHARNWYRTQEGPSIYLPYSEQLARFYKFEEDPEYQADYTHPRDAYIGALLTERTKYTPKQIFH